MKLRTKLPVLALLLAVAMVAAACGSSETTSTDTTGAPPSEEGEAPAATTDDGEEPEPTGDGEAPPATDGDSSELADVAREDTLVVTQNFGSAVGITNPWAVPGYTHQAGNGFMWEGLAYFGIFSDEEIPWLAESMDYNDDLTSLTINIRPGATWSDGVAFTSADVLFTLEGQLNTDTLSYNAPMVQFVESIEAVDDLTVVVNFSQPAPRFKFQVLTLKFDTGMAMVPAHILGSVDDVNAFEGGLDMPTTGPYRTVFWDNTQRVLDLRADWWATETGLQDVPDVKRIVVSNTGGQANQTIEAIAGRVVNNELDTALDFRQDVIVSILEDNSAVTTHSGDNAPYGYLDWWPNSLWMNTAIPPFDDVLVRRALNRAIDRDTLDEVVYDGAEVTTIVPFPLYPGLQAFVDTPGVQALIDQYEPRKFDLDEVASLMTEAGYARNGDDMWEKDGETVNATIQFFAGIHGDIAPILEQMLLNAGFDAALNSGDDAYQTMIDGSPGLYMLGHGASLVDPLTTFELYQSKFAEPIGTAVTGNRLSRYANPEFDAIVEAMGPLEADDPEFLDLATQAMEIYWRDVIDVPIIQWLHRIAYNQTNWTNWPTADNVASGANGAYWAQTGVRVITDLEKTG